MRAAKWMGIVVAGLLSVGTVSAVDNATAPEKLGKSERRAEIQQFRKRLHEELKKQDADLEKLQSNLNAAPESKKVEALTAIVNKMIDQRREMHSELEAVREKIHKARKERQERKVPGFELKKKSSEAMPGTH